MITLWHIYHVKNCRHTSPSKNKYVAVVCFHPNPHGFLINSKVSAYIKKIPELLNSQVLVTAERYSFLEHCSYINCGRLFSFKRSDLSSVQDIQNNTKKEIKEVVSASKLIEPIYKKLICGK